MNKEEILNIIRKYVKEACENDFTGHDWYHIQRVYNNAMLINKKEQADEFILTIIVLMHDLYDRLDALGAIGIARTFTYSGKKGRPIYDPGDNENFESKEYEEKGSKTSISHFYDKLLKIKDLINTETAKEIAIERHKFLEEFLKEFLDEWDGLK